MKTASKYSEYEKLLQVVWLQLYAPLCELDAHFTGAEKESQRENIQFTSSMVTSPVIMRKIRKMRKTHSYFAENVHVFPYAAGLEMKKDNPYKLHNPEWLTICPLEQQWTSKLSVLACKNTYLF